MKSRSGALIWKEPGATANLFVPCLLGDDRLVVPETAGAARNTWCLERATGRTLWRFDHGGHAYPVLCHGDRVLHTSVARTGWDEPARASLFCIRGADGTPVWSAAEREYLFNPLVSGDTVFVCSNTTVRAYSLDAGRLLAALPLEAEAASLQLAPCSTADMLYVWNNSHGRGMHSIAAVAPATAKRLFRGETLTLAEGWRIGEPRGLCAAPIALDDRRLAYLTHDGTVCVIDAATGAGVAEVALKSRPNPSGGLRLAGTRLIAVHGRDVFCLPL